MAYISKIKWTYSGIIHTLYFNNPKEFAFLCHAMKFPNLSGGLVLPSFVHSTIIVLELQLLGGWTGSTCILVPVPAVEDPVSAMEMSSPPSNELLAICVGEEWGGVGLQSIGSPVEVLVVGVSLLTGQLDVVDSLHMTCNSIYFLTAHSKSKNRHELLWQGWEQTDATIHS